MVPWVSGVYFLKIPDEMMKVGFNGVVWSITAGYDTNFVLYLYQQSRKPVGAVVLAPRKLIN